MQINKKIPVSESGRFHGVNENNHSMTNENFSKKIFFNCQPKFNIFKHLQFSSDLTAKKRKIGIYIAQRSNCN